MRAVPAAVGASSRPERPAAFSTASGGPRGDHSAALDYGVLAAAIAVCASSLLVWYERTATVHGVPVTVTARLLSGDAGIQRPLVPAVAGFLVAEVLANRFITARRGRELRSHRGIALACSVADLVLVASCIASSPLSPDQLANLGISLDPAPGSFVALAAAGAGLLIALFRMFSGRSSLGAAGRRR